MKVLVVQFFFFMLYHSFAWSQDAPLSLDRLIDQAVENNYLLQANEKQLEIHESEIDIITTQYRPNITLNASASYWKFLLPNKQRLLGNTLSDVYTDITVRQTLYSWGAQELRKNIVTNEMMLNEELRRQLTSTIIWEVADVYFETMGSKSEIDIHQNALDQLKAHLLYTQNLISIGKVSQVDLLRIEVQISSTEKAFQKAINAYQAQLIRLRRLCYLDEDYWPEIVTSLD